MNAVTRVLDLLPPSAPGAPTIIGIDGPAGSGKSTLAAQIAEATGAGVVGVDEFVGWTDLDPDHRTWWPRLEQEVVEPFFASRPVVYRQRDWLGDPDGLGLLPEPRTIEAGPLLVLEGVSITRLAIAPRLAVRVWVEAPQDVRLARGIARDGEEQLGYWLRWQELEAEHFALDGTRERAHLIVPTA